MLAMKRSSVILLFALICGSGLMQLGCAKCKDFSETRKSKAASEDRDALLKAYEETCKSYHAIDDFRAKLLALLPFATGVGWLFLLAKKDTVTSYLKPIAIFGALVTLGLFIYEARGAQRCDAIKCVARNLEKELGLTEHTGQFLGQPEPYVWVVREFTAGILVYGGVFLGWIWILRAGGSRRSDVE